MLRSHSERETERENKRRLPEPKVVAAAVYELRYGRVKRDRYATHTGP